MAKERCLPVSVWLNYWQVNVVFPTVTMQVAATIGGDELLDILKYLDDFLYTFDASDDINNVISFLLVEQAH